MQRNDQWSLVLVLLRARLCFGLHTLCRAHVTDMCNIIFYHTSYFSIVYMYSQTALGLVVRVWCQDPEERPRAKRILAGSTWLQQFDVPDRRGRWGIVFLRWIKTYGNIWAHPEKQKHATHAEHGHCRHRFLNMTHMTHNHSIYVAYHSTCTSRLTPATGRSESVQRNNGCSARQARHGSKGFRNPRNVQPSAQCLMG